jgi:glycosyltransferase involved in cell wall biosynthesis
VPTEATTPVAIVHDYLTQRGGAERVVETFIAAFPGAPVLTSLYDADATFEAFRAVDVRTGVLDRVAALRRHHRAALPLLAPWFMTRNVDADVVLASSSGWAHEVRTDGRLVVYCHAPARWLYQRDRYLGDAHGGAGVAARCGLAVLSPALRSIDRAAARRADTYLANSSATAAQVRRLYGRDAEVLCPSPALDPAGARAEVAGLEEGVVLCVSRLLPYKHVDIVIEAARALPDRRFCIVGDGPERRRLESAAPRNVTFLGVIGDDELRSCYAAASVLVALSYEDFGLTPLEAASFGTPTVARRFGGYLDTVVDHVTGVLVDDVTPRRVADEITALSEDPPAPDVLRAHAAGFSRDRFIARIREVVTDR